MRKFTISCTVVLLLCAMLFCSCAGNEDSIGNPKTYVDEKISITLTDAFNEDKGSFGFYASYLSKHCGVVIFREAFDGQTGLENVPLSDYLNNYEPTDTDAENTLKINGKHKYWESVTDSKYSHLYCFKGTDAFYRVNFFCTPEKAEMMTPYFLDWALTVDAK